MINSVKGIAPTTQGYEPKEKKDSQNVEVKKEKDSEAAVLELGNTSEKSSLTYRKPKVKNIDYNEVNRLIEEAEKSYEGLRKLVQQLISRQGKKLGDLLSGKEVLIVDEETRAKATEAISENGEWGIEAVSDRLVAFAIAISGNDKTKAGELKDAITKGFKEAERILGGTLPEICQKTYDETMKKLDEWSSSLE